MIFIYFSGFSLFRGSCKKYYLFSIKSLSNNFRSNLNSFENICVRKINLFFVLISTFDKGMEIFLSVNKETNFSS